MFVHVLEPDGCITTCCCCCCCFCCVMSATADAKFQLLLLLLFFSLCIPFACTFSTCDSRLGWWWWWWWCCCCCCGWLTDWLSATLCSLLPTQKALAIITSTQFYFISWMQSQSQSQPQLPPLLPPFVYLVFVSFLHAHKIKCNNSKRCNNSVRYLSRFLFYCSLCLSLSVVFSFAYLIFLLFFSQPAHLLCIYISGLQHAR